MITSPRNPAIQAVRALQAQRRTREAEGRFVIEGPRLAEEAIRAGAPAHLVLHTPDIDARAQAAVQGLTQLGARVEAVSAAALAAASDTRSPAGLLAVVSMPGAPAPLAPSLALVVDRLADPGNLGTLLRTADAAGVQAVFLLPGTVDVFNPKVVRAAMGAHFHLALIPANWDALAGPLAGCAVWLAEAHEGQPYHQVDWTGPAALIVGAEAEGPSAEARAFTPRRVHIPMPGQAESLNAAVAAGILLFEAARQRRAARPV